MNARSFVCLSAATLLTVLSQGCNTDVPTGPPGPQIGAPDGPSALRTRAKKRIKLRNKDRFRDKGDEGVVASLRGVKVAARAFTLRDGTTILETVAGRFSKPDGLIYDLQYAVEDPDGNRLRRSDLYRALESAPNVRGGVPLVRMTFRGIALRSRYVLDVKVKRNRKTEQLRLAAPVELGPDLAVTKVDVPERVHATEVVAFNATVRELNGDMGAGGDCVLYADGVEVDRAAGIWVEAGGTVTCAFAARFSSLGRKSLRAAVVTRTPTEFDPANNSSTVSIDVEPLPLHMSYNAEALQHTGLFLDDYSYKYDDDPITGFGFHSSFTRNNRVEERYQYARIFASAPQGIAFPVAAVSLSQLTDATVLDSRTYADLPGGAPFGTEADGGRCGSDGDGAFAFILCSYHRGPDSWTTIYYSQFSGTVTFVSRFLEKWTAPWKEDDHVDEPGHYESEQQWGRYAPFGETVTFNLSVTSGLFRLVASPTISLTTNAYGDAARTCTDTPLPNGLVTQCTDLKRQFEDRAGSAVP